MGSPALDAVRIAWAPVTEAVARREVAWGLLAELLPGARFTNPCPLCGGPHGPVRVRDASAVASVTYAAGYAVVAVIDTSVASAIGIDAEHGDAAISGGSAASPHSEARLDRVLAPGASLRAWTRVEAVLKADGRGMRVDPGLVEVRGRDLGWDAHIADEDPVLVGADVEGPPGVLVSVALRLTDARGTQG